jgi:hypothetical protein
VELAFNAGRHKMPDYCLKISLLVLLRDGYRSPINPTMPKLIMHFLDNLELKFLIVNNLSDGNILG